jgi:hypothetical protein
MDICGNNTNTNNTNTGAEIKTVKPKRGRRSKKEIEEMKEKEKYNLENNIIIPTPAPKKRGRKPKGGKIIEESSEKKEAVIQKPNIMLHLKCSTRDLEITKNENRKDDFTDSNIGSYDENTLNYHMIDTQNKGNDNTIFQIINSTCSKNETQEAMEEKVEMKVIDENVSTKETYRKLKSLEQLLHINSVPDANSCCFWCSYGFENPPIYIPKFYLKGTYHVYGCFCSPECAVAYLMKENIDSSSKFERYSLLNNIYNKVYDYVKNIKPAPDPHYLLDRFCGNLTIQEYRSLLKSDRLFLIVDKPLTRVLPELHEDNDEFIINNKIIPTSNNYNVKRKSKPTTNNVSGNQTNDEQKNYGIFTMIPAAS